MEGCLVPQWILVSRVGIASKLGVETTGKNLETFGQAFGKWSIANVNRFKAFGTRFSIDTPHAYGSLFIAMPDGC